MDTLKYLGILCLLYYVIMWIHTKRTTTTFAFFWLVTGFLNITLSYLLALCSDRIVTIAGYVIGVLLFIAAVIMIIITSAMLTLPPDGMKYIIVLGAQVRGRKITGSLERRLVKAEAYLAKNPETKVVVSGGQGEGEDISEALAMKLYLEEQGIDKRRIILEDKSTTTKENLAFSKKYIGDPGKQIGVVTNNFHIYRALLIGRRLGFSNLVGISASTNQVLFLNYLVREVFGVIYFFFKRDTVDK